MFLVFSNHFDMLISKIIFKKLKNIINMYFNTKSYLKNNHNHTIYIKKTLTCSVIIKALIFMPITTNCCTMKLDIS